jgi:hypothetical protein
MWGYEIMTTAGAIVLIVFLACGLYGFGAIARRLIGCPPGTWPMTIAIGLAAWIVIGGVLNLARIAFPVVIDLTLVTGCVFGATALHGVKGRRYVIVWLIIAAAIIGFAAVTQAVPTAFNYADDYQKYFAHVARMVETGTLAGSPLNTLGSETFGGQAFLQALFVAHLPFATINSADAVFCFGLLVLLAGGLAIERPGLALVAIAAMALILVFDPLYVSVTALYSAATLMFAIVALNADRREYALGGQAPPPAVMGLLYAALVALKPTFGLFIALHAAMSFATELTARQVLAAIKRVAATAAFGLAFVAPWVALYAPLYWQGFTAPTASLSPAPVPSSETINLFATAPFVNGVSFAQYTLVAAIFLICGAAVAFARRQVFDADAARFVAICLAVPMAYLTMLLVFGPLLAGYGTALRHFLPVLIGTAPAVLILATWLGHGRIAFMLSLLVTLSFAPAFLNRCDLLFRTGSMVAFLRSWPSVDALIANSRDMLERPTVRQRMTALQANVPAGEPLLVWIEAPFLLDFARNPIIDADIGGLATPWAKTPPLSYVMWQYNGPGVRKPRDYDEQMRGPGRRETYLAARGFAYASRLQSLLETSQILANDGSIVVMRIEKGALP